MIYINGRFLTQRTTGVQRYAREVVTRLLTLDPEGFCVLMPRSDVLLAEAFRPHTRQLGRFQGHAWEQLELGAFVQAKRAKLFSPGISSPLLVSRQVITVHDLFALEHPEWVDAKFHLWYSFLLPLLAQRSRPIVSSSHYTKRALIERFAMPESAVEVIPCGVDGFFRSPSEDVVSRIKAKYQLPDRFFLSLGSLEPRKNLHRLVQAWGGLAKSDRLPLLIAGKLGPSQVFGEFDAQALTRNADVRLLGYVPDEDLPGLYACASVFVYPSLLEGFGLPPLEAACCGARVVTSNNSGMLEVMHGVATLVDPLDLASIANGLRQALRAPAPSANLIAELRSRYDWDCSARTLLELLRS